MRKIFGFTLAEVLITLGIIGVVAAMTIPDLIANYQKNVTVTRLKKSYAELNQAVKLSIVDNEDVSGWNFGGDWFAKYLQNYIKGCSRAEFKPFEDENSIPYKMLSGTRDTGLGIFKFNNVLKYTMLNGVEIIVYNNSAEELYYTATTGPEIYIDINGSAQGPNQWGKDFFAFYLYPKYGVYPAGMLPSSAWAVEIPNNIQEHRNLLLSDGHIYHCNKAQRGRFCAAVIMLDGWKISRDYPW